MNTINAKKEFIDITRKYKLIAADITFGNKWDNNYTFKLKPLHTDDDYKRLLDFLDRKYDNDYGSQELFGTIYCEDGVWINRVEYDGSEWWVINKYPNLSESFDDADIIKYERSKKLKKIENIL